MINRGMTMWLAAGVLACGMDTWVLAKRVEVVPELPYPTEKAPFVQGRDDAQRTALQKAVVELLQAPAETLSAHPAAADFPGAVLVSAPLVTCEASVDPGIAGWVSTGVYAVAGRQIGRAHV